jgi:asparagine synthetase B (glutamine-hydrolysing)
MLASMAHRGPDDRGAQALSGGELVFGHLRLSILDLSPLG